MIVGFETRQHAHYAGLQRHTAEGFNAMQLAA